MSYNSKPTNSITSQDHAIATTGHLRQDAQGNLPPPIKTFEYLATRLPPQYIDPLSGAIAGAFAGIVSCPLDVIKTKLQAQGGFRPKSSGASLSSAAYHGISGTAATIWREDGLRGLYRGLSPMLLGYVPTWAVYLTVYNRTQNFYRSKTDNLFLANVCSALSGGASSTFATNPIWVIKTRLMAQSNSRVENCSRPPWQYRNTLDAARKMYRNEGIKSFYSGLTPALLGLAHVAIQFPLYEVFKVEFTGLGTDASKEDKDHHFWGLAGAVFLSKICASTATYPHEVVRTRLQTQQRSLIAESPQEKSRRTLAHQASSPPDGLRYKGTIHTCKAILREEGWRGFYAGLGTNLIRAVPAAMTTILSFEYLKKTFNQAQEDGAARAEARAERI